MPSSIELQQQRAIQQDSLFRQLINATYSNNIDRVRSIFQKCSRIEIDEVINRNDKSHELEHTAVSACCCYNYPVLLEVILSHAKYGGRANPDVVISDGRSPVLIAASLGFTKCLQLLIDHKAMLNVRNTVTGRNPLSAATDNGHGQAVEMLLKNGADVNIREFNGSTALGYAAEHSLEKIILTLMYYGADPEIGVRPEYMNNPSDENVTPLYVATQNGKLKSLRVLISAKASLTNAVCRPDGLSPLCIACANGHDQVAKLLLRYGANVNHSNHRGETPLRHAINGGHLNCMNTLLSLNASLTTATNAELPQSISKVKEYAKFIDIIDTHTTRLKTDDVYALKVACASGDVEKGTQLVRKMKSNASCDVMINHINEDFEWMSALMLAAYYDRHECMSVLISAGCAIDLYSTCDKSRSRSAIMYAAESGALTSIKLLVEVGAEVHKKSTPFGETALSIAAGNGQAEIIRYLLTLQGTDVTAKLNFGLADLSMINNATALALYMASDTCLDEDLILDLLERDLPCNDSGNIRSTHSDSLALVLDCSTERLTEDFRLRAVRTLFERHPLIHKQLATTVDHNDRSIMNITHKSIRKYVEDLIYFCGRYELRPGPPVHRSATALVMLATDHSAEEYYRSAFRTFLTSDRTKSISKLQFFVCLLNIEKLGLHHGLCLNPETTSGWEKLSEHFKACGAGSEENVSEDNFVAYCCALYGKTAKVIIKFMRNKDQYDREKNMRGEGSDYSLNPQYVVNFLHGPSPDRFRADVSKRHFHTHPLFEYKFGLVMPAADKSLDCIFRTEFTDDTLKIMATMKDVAKALKSLHDMGVMHGDVKLLNILQFGSKIKLIDMDAACDIAAGEFAGVKFSSGLLPPEMFYELKSLSEIEQFEAYWSEEKRAFDLGALDSSPTDNYDVEERARQKSMASLWNKVRPREVVKGGKTAHIVVKSYRGPGSIAGLPYSSQLVRASPLIDIWAFGCVLYSLCSGAPLLLSKIDDDILHDDDFMTVFSLNYSRTDRLKRDIAKNVSHPLAQNLLNLVLNPDPLLRLNNMTEVLEHPFFSMQDHRRREG